MKNSILVLTLLTLFSCNNDDEVFYSQNDFVGEWVLLSAKTEREVDYDNDGDGSLDIQEDFNCFTIELKLESDGLFQEVTVDRFIENDIVSCKTFLFKGKWNYNRDTQHIILEYLDDNDNIVKTIESPFILIDNTFTIFRKYSDDIGIFEAVLAFSGLN